MNRDTTLQDLIERQRVLDTITTLFVATDNRDWARVRDCLSPLVTFDVTSMSGGEVQHLTSDAIAAGWEAGLKAIEHVHHQIGNISIALHGADASASCYGIAYHFRRTKSGNNTRTFVGSYDFHLVRAGDHWRIDLFRLRLKFIDGNRVLDTEPAAE